MECTIFKNLRNTKPLETKSLLQILNEIKEGLYKDQVLNCSVDPTKLDKLKEKLPVFTPTGIFSHRSIKGLEKYNGIIYLDIDSVDNPEKLKEQTKNIKWVYSSFITPSRKGLRVLIKTDSTIENYKECEAGIAEAFKILTGYERDKHCKDISRIHFYSYDPDIYINENSTIVNTQFLNEQEINEKMESN